MAVWDRLEIIFLMIISTLQEKMLENNCTNIIVIALLSFLFGFFSKMADLFDEHGLKTHPFISLATGILWGIDGAIIMYINKFAGIAILATVLYWFLKVKLDYINQTIAGVIIFTTALILLTKNLLLMKEFFLLFLIISALGFTNTYLKEKLRSKRARQFFRLRLWIYFAPILYYLLSGNGYPIVVVIVSMIGTELVTFWGNKVTKSSIR